MTSRFTWCLYGDVRMVMMRRYFAAVLLSLVALQAAALHLDRIADAGERREVARVLALIDRGGAFPFRQDAVVFQNRESRLPRHPRGYYHEYTVPTPGARTRGARRIIRGAQGETYYTRDHYQTFLRL
jgi:ribonuclease T1